jgi:hypothetical protein
MTPAPLRRVLDALERCATVLDEVAATDDSRLNKTRDEARAALQAWRERPALAEDSSLAYEIGSRLYSLVSPSSESAEQFKSRAGRVALEIIDLRVLGPREAPPTAAVFVVGEHQACGACGSLVLPTGACVNGCPRDAPVAVDLEGADPGPIVGTWERRPDGALTLRAPAPAEPAPAPTVYCNPACGVAVSEHVPPWHCSPACWAAGRCLHPAPSKAGER